MVSVLGQKLITDIVEGEFPCHSCGACCMMLWDILASDDNVNKDYLDLVHEFPYKADEAGWCEKLDKDLRCSVYEKRPLLCRIKEVWKLKFSKHTTKKDYFTSTVAACKVLMKDKLGMKKSEIDKVYEDLT